MKSHYRLFRRGNGIYFCEDRQTGVQQSLRTKDKSEAVRLLNAKNEAQTDRGLALGIAKAYLNAADPSIARRTWQYAFEELVKTKHGENAQRWNRAIKDKALAKILNLPLVQTRADHFSGLISDQTNLH